MLLILFFIVLLIIGSLLISRCSDWGDYVGFLINVITTIVLVIVLFFGAFNYITAGAQEGAAIEKYSAIQYKVNSETYKDEFGLLNKDVIDEICEWNSNLKWGQEMTRNAFVGILIPNYYDDLEFIELPDK